MTTVFVSGTFDILHAGHVAFLREAKKLGGRLVVCLPSDRVVSLLRDRTPAITLEQKVVLFSELECVDQVCVGDDDPPHLNFAGQLRAIHPDILAVTEDDRYKAEKWALCGEIGCKYIRLPKEPSWPGCSATEIRRRIAAPATIPLRVDFAGGWLDVPRFARPGAFIVNCAITPGVTLESWPYEKPGAGLGGSAAWRILQGEDPLAGELSSGVGWQDPAVIHETGLCVWKSGPRPVLSLKVNPGWLVGRMALLWTGRHRVAGEIADRPRDYNDIERAGLLAARAVRNVDYHGLVNAVHWTSLLQESEGMEPLPKIPGTVARKYCGAGHGGYALYLFADQKARDASGLVPIEPYMRSVE